MQAGAQLRPVSAPSAHLIRGRTMFLLRWIGRALPSNKLSTPFLTTDEKYHPPGWARCIGLVPKHRMGLGMLPTPIHRWHLPGLPEGADAVQVYIKRDDLTGMQLSGNKVRKLEFLVAEAVRLGHDCIVTIGGIQSNHCRATAVAAKYAGLGCHLILRCSRQVVDQDPGLTGNLLVDRMVGARLHLVTKEEYSQEGSMGLGHALVEQLRAKGKNPYLVPVGGSSALGTWGYVQACEEMRQQTMGMGVTDIAMACGSGGTTAGLCLGAHLAWPTPLAVHAYCVCDTPDYFYDYIDGLLEELGVWDTAKAAPQGGAKGEGGSSNSSAIPSARGLLRVVQARGTGYAMSTDAELETVKEVAEATGIVLDPVYSGKAIHGLLSEIRASPDAWRGRKVLFIHTGGLLGLYDKQAQLEQAFGGKAAAGYGARVERMQIPAQLAARAKTGMMH